jgi:hypothetical protein
MQDLISQLSRLYLLEEQTCFDSGQPDRPLPLTTVRLEQHLLGVNTLSLALLSTSAATPSSGRAIVLDFCAGGTRAGEQNWRAMCAVANGLRDTLGLAAPAVSISGRGFQLWLSLQRPLPAARIAEFARLLQRAFLPEEAGAAVDARNGALATVTELPPARHAGGKWSAFIHPGMGASFADEPFLEMAPPVGAQVGFLEGLLSITAAEFDEALLSLRARVGHDMQPAIPAPVTAQSAAAGAATSPNDGLLLKDATIDDIVRHLHALHIEPTLRYLYLLPPS